MPENLRGYFFDSHCTASSDNLVSTVSHVQVHNYIQARLHGVHAVHANKSSDLLAWWTLEKTTRPAR